MLKPFTCFRSTSALVNWWQSPATVENRQQESKSSQKAAQYPKPPVYFSIARFISIFIRIYAAVQQQNHDKGALLQGKACWEECKLTSVCGVSNVLSVAGADEQLDLREQCFKVWDVGHRELYKSRVIKQQHEHVNTQMPQQQHIYCKDWFDEQISLFYLTGRLSDACLTLTAQLKLQASAPECPALLTQCPGGRGSLPAVLRFYWSAHTTESSGLEHTHKHRNNEERCCVKKTKARWYTDDA